MDESDLYSNQRGRLPRREAIKLADLILWGEKKKLPIVIIFAGDPLLKKLNRRYRRLNRPTDVLSFESDPALGLTGEIYLSIDTARRQAREYKTTLRDEILRLVAHGTLHLCGYDHKKKDDFEIMQAREDHYLNKLKKR